MADSKEVGVLLENILSAGVLKKAVLSRARDRSILKTQIHPYLQKGQPFLQFSVYSTDHKVQHENIPLHQADRTLLEKLTGQYRQLNLITTAGDCEIKANKTGEHFLIRGCTHFADAPVAEVSAHNKSKRYLLPENTPCDFLYKLGIMDENGRVFDRATDKFRQINRFWDVLDDLSDHFTSKKQVAVADLCCGKSYLTFAVYYYFSNILHKKVQIYGVDLKEDVIDYCARTARELGMDGMHFLKKDILQYEPPEKIDLVLSLHACDIATDIVLSSAVRWQVPIILSCPCCQHELAAQMPDNALEVVTHYPLLKQRLAALATDALRGQLLEAFGYRVQMIELIDPEFTPKNLLIRAVKFSQATAPHAEKIEEYRQFCENFSVKPAMARLLQNAGLF